MYNRVQISDCALLQQNDDDDYNDDSDDDDDDDDDERIIEQKHCFKSNATFIFLLLGVRL